MSAATTIAPVLNPIPAAPPPPRRIDSHPSDPPLAAPVETPIEAPAKSPIVEPQHMQALARANRVRLARAELKRQVGAGRRDVIEVVLDCPWEAESMSVSELLQSQRRWGRARSRKLIVSAELTENKRLGTLTDRQRRVLAGALEAKATC
jgi:hypothetical protein